jgi:HNH endonuclease
MSYDDWGEPAECGCGRGTYNPTKYNACYECFQDRMADLTSCIYCGKKHSIDYPTCFDCRQIAGRDEAGKNLRLDILIRDDFTCQGYDFAGRRCGSHEALQIDHIKPCASHGMANPWNLQVLCRECNRVKGSNWYYGCLWDTKRKELICLYLTFGWSLLSEDEQQDLVIDTADYTEFDERARVREYNEHDFEPPAWAVAMADAESVG